MVREPQLVRSVIGLTGQYAAVDDDLTGRENLVLVGRLSRMPKDGAHDRAARLLDVFELAIAADRPLRTYSGGMRRRLDLAASLMVSPPVLFLDEPTTGLDPRSRLQLWDVINGLRAEGTTIDPHNARYLEKADWLVDPDQGAVDVSRIIFEGTADELKRQVGGDVVDLQLADRSRTGEAADALARAFAVDRDEVVVDDELGSVRVPVASGAAALIDAVRALDAEHVPVADLGLRRPSLDDVFLSLTGHHAEEPRPEATQPSPGRRGMIG